MTKKFGYLDLFMHTEQGDMHYSIGGITLCMGGANVNNSINKI